MLTSADPALPPPVLLQCHKHALALRRPWWLPLILWDRVVAILKPLLLQELLWELGRFRSGCPSNIQGLAGINFAVHNNDPASPSSSYHMVSGSTVVSVFDHFFFTSAQPFFTFLIFWIPCRTCLQHYGEPVWVSACDACRGDSGFLWNDSGLLHY